MVTLPPFNHSSGQYKFTYGYHEQIKKNKRKTRKDKNEK